MKRYSRMISLAAAAAVACSQMIIPAAAEENVEVSLDEVVSASALRYEAKASASDFEYGDANGDGKVQADDAAMVLQKALNSSYKMEIEDKTDEYLTVVDVDGDSKITAADAAAIMQKVLNGNFKFKAEGGSGEIPTVEETSTETTTTAVQESSSESTTAAESGSTEETTVLELDIVLSDGASSVSGADSASQYVAVDNSTNIITILSPGTYNFSGTLTNGQIVVNIDESYTDNNAEINFNGVNITNNSGPAIYGINGDIKLSAKKGTVNTLSDGTPTVFETETAEDGTVTTTDEPDGCIFSHDGITLKGKGELIINGNYANGISGKDEVEIKNLTLTINSVDNAIKGKDYVTVESGTLDLTSKTGNGIQCTKGDVTILDGSITVNAADKGIGAKVGNVVISGGTVNVTVVPDSAGYNSAYNYDGIFAKAGAVTISGGDITVKSYCDGLQAATDVNISGEAVLNITTVGTINTSDDISAKGIKGDTSVTLDGGTITVVSTDDSIHTDGDMTINAANITVSSSDDGLHADNILTINDGCVLNVLKSYEGVEGWYIYINGGTMNIYSSDDNINAAGGNDTTSSNQNRFGSNSGSTGYLEINGGCIYCENSSTMGDGVDSNGDLVINGGVVIVNGPTSDGDTAVDCGDGSQLYCNGGVLFAVGSSGMAESPSTNGKGYAVTYGVSGGMGGGMGGPGGMGRPGQGGTSGSTIAAGTLLTLADANGNVVAALKVKVNTSAVILSSDSIVKGGTYTLYSGGTYTGTLDENGYGTGGTISGGTKVASGTISSAVTALS